MFQKFYQPVLLALVFCTTVILQSSCSKDEGSSTVDVCNSSTFEERIPVLLMEYTTALQNYGAEPSDANCQAFLKAFDDYIDFLREVDDCPFTVGNMQINEIISESNATRAEFPCS